MSWPLLAPYSRQAPPRRILVDLALGQLDDTEVEALGAWFCTDELLEPTEHLIQLGIGARGEVLTPV